jgi:hypothetical protein
MRGQRFGDALLDFGTRGAECDDAFAVWTVGTPAAVFGLS